MKISTQKGEHSYTCTELSLKQSKYKDKMEIQYLMETHSVTEVSW